ncbi:hypothetical protein GLAREA_04442 [Glarea lozoyensis ATCC 20868]|uniref:DUF4105 domain-containing protein n=1 Tax=Glarea lozoyensis (strain ATCC 20868 / MF5171) TaxID=1116229 RepID=S3D6I1_GLAL2|nr:uncharacterized protein GLAREA_04442 [Glarea lozoyensis ATCC 20868]EPE27651.1 hypothetical protein GLAREA_04442 [Glarea lozoyensis ATCC 20868]
MKFLATLSTLVFALSLSTYAAPAENVNHLELEARVPALAPAYEYTAAYRYFHGIKNDILPQHTYIFTMRIPVKTTETNARALALSQQLGFSHIYFISVHVTQSERVRTTGPRATRGQRIITLAADAQVFDMVKAAATTGVQFRQRPFRVPTTANSPGVVFVKTTTRTKAQIKTEAQRYVAQNPQYSYEATGNNCGTFVDNLIEFA